MRIEKKVLNDALRVLGKVVCQTSPVELYRSVRFVGNENGIRVMVTDGVEMVSVAVDAFTETEIDFCVPFKELKDLIRMGRSETIELNGTFIEFPILEEPSADAISAILPVDFGELLSQAALVINRNEYRKVLQGINLSPDGITVTDGKQLLHQPCHLSLVGDVTIPFPSALLAYRPQEMGTLCIWNGLFRIKIDGFRWQGRITEGQYPNWKSIIPTEQTLNYKIQLHELEKVIDWVKMIPAQKTTNGVEISMESPERIKLRSGIQPDFVLITSGTSDGIDTDFVLSLDRDILLRMLLQGYTTFRGSTGGSTPVIASGGSGQYIAMPIRTMNTKYNPIPTHQEKKEMETENTNVVEQQNAAPVVNPLDELNANVEEFRGKLKLLLDESGVLIRKVKEVALIQKQKERDFIQARRAIERIRMAI